MRTVQPGLLLVAIVSAGCIESRLSVELFTQIQADGSCTRRVEYRLERIDTDKAGARVAIPAAEDALLQAHRFPAGEAWQRHEERDIGLHLIVLEASLSSPAGADGDFFRARSAKAPPARNFVSAFVDAEHEVYEYEEMLRDPASPLAAARELSRAALHRDGAFAAAFQAALAGKGAGPRDSDVRRAFRERLAEPFAREVTLLAERPLFGPRERRELDQVFDRLNAKQKALATRLSALAAGTALEDVEAASEGAFNAVGEQLLDELTEAGLPLLTPDGKDRSHFRATLVMPAAILRANTCVAGDTAIWEFDDDDLYGRGFEMKALATPR